MNVTQPQEGIYRVQLGLVQGQPGTASEAIRDDVVTLQTSWSSQKTREEIEAARVTELAWDKVTGKPKTFPPSTHTHSYASITGKPSTFPPAAHTHEAGDLQSLISDTTTTTDRTWSGIQQIAMRHEHTNLIPNGALESNQLGGVWPDDGRFQIERVDVPPGEIAAVKLPAERRSHELPRAGFALLSARDYKFSCWVKADKPGSAVYLAMDDLAGRMIVSRGTVGETIGSYLLGRYRVPTEWTYVESVITLVPSVTRGRLAYVYTNHSAGETTDATVMLSGLRLTPLPDKHKHAWEDITGTPTEYTPAAHSAELVTSGTLDPARLPQATDTTVGGIEIATSSEAAAGADSTRAVTPAGLTAWARRKPTAIIIGASNDVAGEWDIKFGQLAGYDIINVARGGTGYRQALQPDFDAQFDEAVGLAEGREVGLVIFGSGANDVRAGHNVRSVAQELFARARATYPHARIITIPAWWNHAALNDKISVKTELMNHLARIRDAAAPARVEVVTSAHLWHLGSMDFVKSGEVHFTASGNDRIAEWLTLWLAGNDLSDVSNWQQAVSKDTSYYTVTAYNNYRALAARRTGQLVTLSGHVKSANTTQALSDWATVPLGLRPAEETSGVARVSGGGLAEIVVFPSGVLRTMSKLDGSSRLLVNLQYELF